MLDVPRAELSGNDLELVQDVEEHGFHWLHIFQSADDPAVPAEWLDVPNWSYTIGFWATWRHPEVVVFTLDREIARPLFWDLARQIAEGRRFEPGAVYEDALPSFEGQACAFEPVSPGWLEPLFGTALWLYGGEPFPVLQYLWPDRNGRFGWEDGVLAHVTDAQRRLDAPPREPDAPPPPRV